MIHHILRMQNFFTKCNGSGTFQSPKHAAHARPVWDHYGDCPSSGDIALAPWGAGTRGHLWETTADRVTTFLICRWGGGEGLELERYLRQKRKEFKILKHILCYFCLWGRIFWEQIRNCAVRDLHCGLDISILMFTAERNEELLAHSLTSQGQEASDHSQEDKHLGSTEGKEGEDEAYHQDDETAEQHSGGCPSPSYKEKQTVINTTDIAKFKNYLTKHQQVFFSF